MPLLSTIQKNQIAASLMALHDELSRNIEIYQIEGKIIINTDENFSGAYNYSTSNTEYIRNKKTVKARVYYNDTILKDFSVLDAGLKIKTADGKVTIRVMEDGYDAMKEVDEIILDGKEMSIESASKPVGNGVFNNIFWDFILKPVSNEN